MRTVDASEGTARASVWNRPSIWRILALALAGFLVAVAVAAGAVASPALAVEGGVRSGTWGTCAWDLADDGTLTVQGGAGAESNGSDSPWADLPVKKVVLAGDVVAPADCSFLFSLEQLESIEGLARLDISASENLSGMFRGCASLASLVLPSSFDTSQVTSMFGMFYECSALKSLVLPDSFDTSKVEHMMSMFYGCSSLETLELPDVFDTSSAKALSLMFYGCSSLPKLDLPAAFDTSSALTLSSMFERCSSLASLVLPDAFDTSNARVMSGMFAGCEKLASLTLPAAFDTSNANTVGMFNFVDSLVCVEVKGDKVTFGQALITPGVTVDNVHTGRWREVGGGTVNNPQGEIYASLPNNVSGVFVPEVQPGTWGQCVWTLSSDGTLAIKPGLFGGLGADAGASTNNKSPWTGLAVKKVVIEGKVVAPADCGFLFALEGLESIEGLENLDVSNATNMAGMFKGCANLASLELPPSFDTSRVRNMLGMFYECPSLATLSLPASFNTSNVSLAASMFYGCSSLTSLVLPDAFTLPKAASLSLMFHGCSSLESVVFPEGFSSNATSYGSMFNGCSSLASLELPTGFDASKAVDLSGMFSGCASLGSLTLPEAFDTSKATSSHNMFKGVASLVRVELKGTRFTLAGAFPAPGVAGKGYTGRWQAVGDGDEAAPRGPVHDSIPTGTAGVFVPERAKSTTGPSTPPQEGEPSGPAAGTDADDETTKGPSKLAPTGDSGPVSAFAGLALISATCAATAASRMRGRGRGRSERM